MAIAGMPNRSLRRDQSGYSRLYWALVISAVFHVLAYGAYRVEKKYSLLEQVHLPTWLTPVKKVAEAIKKQIEPPKQPTAVPLVFVDVSPSQAVTEAPKNPKFYSDKSSVAANKNSEADKDIPKIDGKQTDIVKSADVSREKFLPLQPSPPAPPTKEPPQKPVAAAPQEKPVPTPTPDERPPTPKVADEKPKSKPEQPPGDLAMIKPTPAAPPQESKVEPPAKRPRTIKEALAQQPQAARDQLVGQKMKQDGGVKRQALDPGFDVAASPFGAYDRALIEAISQRWYDLLDARDYSSDGRGKVVLQFRLHYDGRITDVSIAENNAGEMLGLLCQKALVDPAPFAVWPADMRRLLGDTRNIQFTFYYN